MTESRERPVFLLVFGHSAVPDLKITVLYTDDRYWLCRRTEDDPNRPLDNRWLDCLLSKIIGHTLWLSFPSLFQAISFGGPFGPGMLDGATRALHVSQLPTQVHTILDPATCCEGHSA